MAEQQSPIKALNHSVHPLIHSGHGLPVVLMNFKTKVQKDWHNSCLLVLSLQPTRLAHSWKL